MFSLPSFGLVDLQKNAQAIRGCFFGGGRSTRHVFAKRGPKMGPVCCGFGLNASLGPSVIQLGGNPSGLQSRMYIPLPRPSVAEQRLHGIETLDG